MRTGAGCARLGYGISHRELTSSVRLATSPSQLDKISWVRGINGALAIALGVVILVWPSISLHALTILVGAYTLASEVIGLVATFGSEDGRGWTTVGKPADHARPEASQHASPDWRSAGAERRNSAKPGAPQGVEFSNLSIASTERADLPMKPITGLASIRSVNSCS